MIREKGSMSSEEIAKLMAKHLGAYFGPAVNATIDSGYIYTVWTHIRGFFYTYTYAYGLIISKALYAKYKADPAYMGEIKKFLSAGGSMSPDDIFKSIGIDTRDPKFFEEGLKQIEEDIKRLEKLTSGKNK
jgi:oligoendopeptidase F